MNPGRLHVPRAIVFLTAATLLISGALTIAAAIVTTMGGAS
ncbi:MAG: hypothetical protein PIR02_16115 [Microbacterium enclense]